MNQKNEIDPRLIKKLRVLQTSPVRNPGKKETGRAAFLQEAQEWAGTVTPQAKRRHNGWMQAIQSIFFIHRKERSPMFSTLATIILIFSLVLGGGGVTVAAAQGSQPDQPLYGMKLWSEDFRLNMTSEPQSQFNLSLKFANRRAEEIRTMLQSGSIPPEAIQTRYQNQLEQAIRFAMDLPDDQAILALEQIRTRLQTQEQTFLQVKANASPNAEAVLLRTREMIREQLRLVEEGLTDPIQLREHLRLREQLQIQDQSPSSTSEENGNQAGPGTDSGNPWTTGTPTPESGYGPGPGPSPDATCTCATCPCDGSGPQPTQQKIQQQTQAGPQPTQQQQGQSTQDGNGPQPTQSGNGPQSTMSPGGQGGKP